MRYKTLIITLLTALILGVSMVATAKPKAQKIYVFGFAASFADSVAYVTDIQLLDPAYIETKSGFLYDRSLYSLQLYNYLEEKQNIKYPTCTIFFSKNRNKLSKKLATVRKKQSKNEGMTIRDLKVESFKFYAEEWTDHDPVGTSN